MKMSRVEVNSVVIPKKTPQQEKIPQKQNIVKSMIGRFARWRARGRHENLWGYSFILPWIIGFFLLVAFPFFFSLYISLTNWNILGARKFIGLRNFQEILFLDPRIWKTLYNTAYLAFFCVIICTIVALGLALLVNQKVKFKSTFRLVFYLPSVVAGVSLFILWTWIFDPSRKGLMNMVIGFFGLGPIGWHKSEIWVKPSLILMYCFLVGGGMMIFLAGLQGISEQLYESAEIDGASRMRKFFSITLPMLSPTLFLQLTMGIIGYFQVFVPIFIMTGGGPADASLVLSLSIYRNAFEWYRMGYACAISWFMFVVVMILTAFHFIGSKRWVYYEA